MSGHLLRGSDELQLTWVALERILREFWLWLRFVRVYCVVPCCMMMRHFLFLHARGQARDRNMVLDRVRLFA